MALQYSVLLRNNRLDQVESTLGTSAFIDMRSGSPPANCDTASSGTQLATGNLPSDWMNAASGGTKTLLGSWTLTGLGSGTLGYFRLYKAGSPSECHVQGTITATGGGGDMTVDNTSVAASQTITVTSFTL